MTRKLDNLICTAVVGNTTSVSIRNHTYFSWNAPLRVSLLIQKLNSQQLIGEWYEQVWSSACPG